MRPDLRKVDERVDLAKKVMVRDMALEAEAWNSVSCITRGSPIIDQISCSAGPAIKRTFSTSGNGAGSSSAQAATFGPVIWKPFDGLFRSSELLADLFLDGVILGQFKHPLFGKELVESSSLTLALRFRTITSPLSYVLGPGRYPLSASSGSS